MKPTRLSKSLVKSSEQTTEFLKKEFGSPKYIVLESDSECVWVYTDVYVQSNVGFFGTDGFLYLHSFPSMAEREPYARFWVNMKNKVVRHTTSGYALEKVNWKVNGILAGSFILVGATIILVIELLDPY